GHVVAMPSNTPRPRPYLSAARPLHGRWLTACSGEDSDARARCRSSGPLRASPSTLTALSLCRCSIHIKASFPPFRPLGVSPVLGLSLCFASEIRLRLAPCPPTVDDGREENRPVLDGHDLKEARQLPIEPREGAGLVVRSAHGVEFDQHI